MTLNRTTPDYGALLSGLLDRGYTRAITPVANAILNDSQRGLLAQRLTDMENEAARLEAAGLPLSPQNPVLRALQADLDHALNATSRTMNNAASGIAQTGVDAAGQWARQTALPGIPDNTLAQLGISWNQPDPEAIARVVDYTQGAAWRGELERYAEGIGDVVQNVAVRGIAEGHNPLRIARELANMVQTLPLARANTLLRTLQLESYRGATQANYLANADILTEQIRIAALDSRCCLACVALHGTRMPLGEKIVEHHAGRCTSIPVVIGRPRDVQTGEDWFNNLPPERQLELAGPGNFEALKSGRATLKDFVHPYDDPVFGRMVRQSSLKSIRNNPDSLVATVNGMLSRDRGTPGNTIASLESFLDGSTGPLANAIGDLDMKLIGFDQTGFIIQRENVARAARQFVVESQDIRYGKDYMLSLVGERAQENGVNLTGIDLERLYNQHMADRARAIQITAQIGNVRLTEAQIRRLEIATHNGWLDMVYSTESSERGSLANATRRHRGALTDIEYRQARENFRDWVLGQ